MYFEYKDYVKDNSVYQDMLHVMRQETDEFMKYFKDDPRFLSGWGHGYFCNEDGGRLVYDITKPFEHKCSICGRTYNEFIYDSYFITMFRNEAVITALKAALLYNLYKEEAHLLAVKTIIGFYAENYEHFAVHAKEKINCNLNHDVGGAGKIMPQGLNEAIVAIRFINALELVKDHLDKEWLTMLKEKLFTPMFDLLLPQKMHIHNIPVWINSAIGMMGLFFDEDKWIKEATTAPFHLYEQIKKGVTDSGFWYEGSIHYNFFALEGIMSFLVFARSYEFVLNEETEKTVLSMLEAAYHYAFDNDIFPNPSDGWPNISLQTYSYIYYMGYKVFGEKVLPYIKHIEATECERGKLPLSEPYYFQNKISLERVLFGPDACELSAPKAAKRKSENFAGSNCAVLRNDTFNVFLKYGHQTKSHAHPDKMNVEIMVKNQVLTKDLSNSGYASKLCNGWHRTIAAHNTCVINGLPTNVQHGGEVLEFTNQTVEAKANAYEDAVYKRKLEIKQDNLTDTFTVISNEEGTIDWFFHFETPIDVKNLKLTPVSLFSEYQYVENVSEIELESNQLELTNDLVKMELTLEEGMKAYFVKTYNNPADKMRDTVILRKVGNQAVFHNVITAI